VSEALQEVLGPTSPISIGVLLVGVGALLAGIGSLFRGIDHLVNVQEKIGARKEVAGRKKASTVTTRDDTNHSEGA
jgi:hypothetical protein